MWKWIAVGTGSVVALGTSFGLGRWSGKASRDKFYAANGIEIEQIKAKVAKEKTKKAA